MTRRLTITSAEMGELAQRPDLQLLPSVDGEMTPIKQQETLWRKPSKWQICMPRLRFVAKVIASLFLFAIGLKILTQGPPQTRENNMFRPAQPPDNTGEDFTEATEEEMIAASKKEEWIWKDYDL